MSLIAQPASPTSVLPAETGEYSGMHVMDYIDAVTQSTPLAASTQAVLWRVGRFYNRKTGESRPSIATVAKRCHLHRDTVRLAYTELAAAGIVSVQHRAGKAPIVRFPTHPALSTPRGNPAGSSYPHPAEIPRPPRGNPAGTPRKSRDELLYEPLKEPLAPAPRCDVCGERHNIGARCDGPPRTPALDALARIRERYEWQR